MLFFVASKELFDFCYAHTCTWTFYKYPEWLKKTDQLVINYHTKKKCGCLMNNFNEYYHYYPIERGEGKNGTYQMYMLVCSIRERGREADRQRDRESVCERKIEEKSNVLTKWKTLHLWENRNIIDLGQKWERTKKKITRRVVILGQLQLNRQAGQTNRQLNSNDQPFDHMSLVILWYIFLFTIFQCLHLEILFSVRIICSKWPFHRFRANSSVWNICKHIFLF